ncbi:MAG TPA: helix-hairpin-helix domain-containing protein, partial [Candidatus Polarisedimenticolia bacterium]
KNGPFKRLEDLLNVRGIGEKTYERIKDRVTLGKS